MPSPRGTEFVVLRGVPIDNFCVQINSDLTYSTFSTPPQTFVDTLPIVHYVTNGTTDSLPSGIFATEIGSGVSASNYIQWTGTFSTNGLFVIARGAGDILAMFRVVEPPVPTLTIGGTSGKLSPGQKNVSYYSSAIVASPSAPVTTQVETVNPSNGTQYTTSASPINIVIHFPQAAGWFAEGLPAGLSIVQNSNNGLITGLPSVSTAPGPDADVFITYNYFVGSIEQGVTVLTTIKIAETYPHITSPNTFALLVGVPFSFNITSPDSPFYSVAATITLAGSVPAGLTLGAVDGNGTAVLSGTPTGPEPCPVGAQLVMFATAVNASATFSNVQTITYTLIDPNPPVVTAATVGAGTAGPPGVSIDTPATPKIYMNEPWAGYQVIASRCPTLFSATSLPPGTSINSSTGLISGTPTTPGIYSTVVTATNGYGSGTDTITITISFRGCAFINPDPNESCGPNASIVDWQQNIAGFDDFLSATNSPQNWGATGLPTGLSINPATGEISGTPTVVANNAQVTITVDNIGLYGAVPADPATTGILTINVVATAAEITPAITSDLNPLMPAPNNVASGIRGVPFSYTVTATHCPTLFGYTPSELPPGLTMDVGTGIISGTPTDVGFFDAVITAQNVWGTGSATIRFIISYPAPVVTSPLMTFGVSGEVFAPPVSQGGGTPAGYHITASIADPSDTIDGYVCGDLPTGLTLNASTGVISGTITAAPATYTVAISATNNNAHTNVPELPAGTPLLTVPALPPVFVNLTFFVYAEPPTITAVSPDFASSAGTDQLTITGTGFLSGASVLFGNMSFTAGTNVTVVNSTTITVTVPALLVSGEAYDVVVLNPDDQAGELENALLILPPGVSAIDELAYTSLYTNRDPIYDVDRVSGISNRKSRIFGLGTNMEVLFYSGIDVPNNTILNVQRQQLGTTATRHSSGDLVFKGIASVETSPFMYKTNGSDIASIDCMLRSNGRIDMHLRKTSGSFFAEDSAALYAAYQATLIKSLEPLPPPKIGTPDCA